MQKVPHYFIKVMTNPYVNDTINNNEKDPSNHDFELIKRTLNEHRFRYERPIGNGGFASVHLVVNERYNQPFVVKVTKLKNGMTEEDHAEISNLINLTHPNIISMFEYFSDDVYLYIILEYCSGGSLQDVIKRDGYIKPPLLYHYYYQICAALKHCHMRSIAHRDLKPANVLIDNYGRLKIADFGLSCRNEGEIIHSFVGSRSYMAPEVITRVGYDPFLADIWSLGVTFYQMAAGCLPWNAESHKELLLSISIGMVSFNKTTIPPEVVPILKNMICVNTKKRVYLDWIMEQAVIKDAAQRPQSDVKTIHMNIGTSVSFNGVKRPTCLSPGSCILQNPGNGSINDNSTDSLNMKGIPLTRSFKNFGKRRKHVVSSFRMNNPIPKEPQPTFA